MYRPVTHIFVTVNISENCLPEGCNLPYSKIREVRHQDDAQHEGPGQVLTQPPQEDPDRICGTHSLSNMYVYYCYSIVTGRLRVKTASFRNRMVYI